MCDWMAACAELVSPVWERMEVVLTSRAVQTDDTPVQVLEEASPYAHRPDLDVCGGDRNRPYIVYDYTGNHSLEGPEEFLKGYNGYLQADAYRGYDAMFKNRKQNLTEVGCWAHSR
jgi:transposase